MAPGMVQANDGRPRSGHRGRRGDDATRPLMGGAASKPQQMHQHGESGDESSRLIDGLNRRRNLRGNR